MISLSTNRMKILNTLLETKKRFTYEELSDKTDIPITTLKENLYALEKAEIIKRESINLNNKSGRPTIFWSMK